MKSFMFVAVAIVLVLGLSQVAQAQGYASAGARIEMDVANTLTITGQEVVWTGLTQGQCYIITPDGFITPPTPDFPASTAGQDFPAFTLDDANPGDLLELDFILPSFALENSGSGLGRIALSDWQYGLDVDGDLTNGLNAQGPINGPVTIVAALGANIYLGWKACVDVGAQAGAYEAQVVLEAHYLASQNP